MVLEEMSDNHFGGARGDEAPSVAENMDILSSMVSVVCTSTVSPLLEIIHLSSFGSTDFKKHVRICNNY